MTGKKNQNVALVAAILFAAVAISGSMIYLGYQLGNQPVAGGPTNGTAVVANTPSEQIAQEVRTALNFPDLFAVDYKEIDFSKRNDHLQGDEDTRFSLIEYSDYECPYCQQFHAVPPLVLEAYPEEVNWVYRHYPLPSHDPQATDLAVAAECVAAIGSEELFWSFTDASFADFGRPDTEAKINEIIARYKGVSETAMQNCIEDGEALAKVKAQMQKGAELGVSGTPNIIVADHQEKRAIMVPGGISDQGFAAILTIMGANSSADAATEAS